ncbi:MAG: HAD family phosphatase [Clostridia bacterium]|nr:HAD family phosphatase [Clostridia bacterium]MBR6784273.1 HAD family phosphatase [Clostridia bacterium]
MIKAAVFDFDGTLFDTMPFWATVGTRMVKKAGLEPVENLDEMVLFMTLEESCAFIKQTYSLDNSIEELVNNVIKEVYGYYTQQAAPKSFIPEFLKKLKNKNIPCAIATASDRRLIELALKRFGLEEYFDKIFTCSELKLNKQSGEIYEIAAKSLGANIKETAVFEDILLAVRSAKQAGFLTVAIEDSESERDKQEIIKTADIYIRDENDLQKFWSYTE